MHVWSVSLYYSSECVRMNKAFSGTFRVSLPWRSCQCPRQGVKWCVGYLGCVSYCRQCLPYIGHQRSVHNTDVTHTHRHTHTNVNIYMHTSRMCTHKSLKVKLYSSGPVCSYPCRALIINGSHDCGLGLAMFNVFTGDTFSSVFMHTQPAYLVYLADNSELFLSTEKNSNINLLKLPWWNLSQSHCLLELLFCVFYSSRFKSNIFENDSWKCQRGEWPPKYKCSGLKKAASPRRVVTPPAYEYFARAVELFLPPFFSFRLWGDRVCFSLQKSSKQQSGSSRSGPCLWSRLSPV